MKRKLLLILATSFLLVGCGTKTSTPTSSNSQATPSSESSSNQESSTDDSTEQSSSESSSSEDTSSEDQSSSGDSSSEEESSSEESSSEQSSSESSEESSSSSEEIPPEPGNDYDYNGYYAGLAWENSEDLINKLHAIISSGYTSLKYEGNWDTNKGADQALDDFEMVDVVYSDENDLKTNTYANGKGWQREHAFAASLMTGFTSGDAVGVHQGRATDFHNLFASNFSGNTSRGNKNFGVANTEDPTYQDFGSYTFDEKNFEPSDNDKGRLSRAIFYMAVMYNQTEQETVKVTLNYSDEDKVTYGKASTTVPITVTYQPLTIVEDYVPYSKYTYTSWYYKLRGGNMTDEDYQLMLDTIDQYGEGVEGYTAYSMANCQYAIGNLSTLLNWNSYDVDYLEMQHNDYVFGESGQGNRNPFVDFPELVSYCFGDKKNEAGSLEDLTPSYTVLEMDKDEIHHYALSSAKRAYDEGATFTSSDYTVVAVYNDLSTATATYEDQTPDYAFTAADVAAGSKVLTINTPKNDIKLKVVVNVGSIDSCSYQGLVVNLTKSAFSRGGTTAVNGQNWVVNWTNDAGAVGSKDPTYGLAFGVASGNKYMSELTFETDTSKTVDKVYFKGSCKAGQTINVTIQVGDQIVCQKSITRTSGVTTAPEVVGASFAQLSGKVKITINGDGANAGAIYVHTLAFNEVH